MSKAKSPKRVNLSVKRKKEKISAQEHTPSFSS